MPDSLRAALVRAGETLDSPFEARVLLEEAAGKRFCELVFSLDEVIAPEVEAALSSRVARRRAGEPLQHIASSWSFYSIELALDGRALVPRPETEIVVEHALASLSHRPSRARSPLVLDLGTGSGAIALALAQEHQSCRVLAIDRSEQALFLASANRRTLAPEVARRVVLACANWADALTPPARFDLVVSNPPYLAEEEWPGLDSEVRDFEPKEALVAGPNGLEAIAAVIGAARDHLVPGGALVCELAPHQAGEAARLAKSAGALEAAVHKDLADRPRVLVARY